jgi:hypothetical protein
VTRAKPSPPPGRKAAQAKGAQATGAPAKGAPAKATAAAASEKVSEKVPEKAPEQAPQPALAGPDLAGDAVGAILAVLADTSEALMAGEVKQRLVARGASLADADRAWSRSQEKIRFHENVVVENRAYRYTAQPRTITPAEAVYHLSKGGTPGQRAAWRAVIESALAAEVNDPAQLDDARTRIAEAERRISDLEEELKRASVPAEPVAPVEESAHDQYDRAERRRAARERQARIDAMSTVAELAAEVEELTAKRASAEVLLEHTRALTGDRGLEAIGRAGELSPYDETRHDPVGDVPGEGEPVIVIRPGYLWHAPGEAVLISRAVVKRK